VRSGGLDLVCLDTSRSMLARDMRPRLTRASADQGLLDRLGGDRVA
jgi:hypothetical protein